MEYFYRKLILFVAIGIWIIIVAVWSVYEEKFYIAKTLRAFDLDALIVSPDSRFIFQAK